MKHESEIALRNAIKERERLCDAFRAQSKKARNARLVIQKILEANDLEFCEHNLAIFGSRRYAKYKIEGVDRAITKREYKQSIENEAKFN